MMTQKTGALIFDETADRYDIRFDVADYYGGLALRRVHGGIRAGQMEADPHGVRRTTGILWVSAPQDLNGLRVRI